MLAKTRGQHLAYRSQRGCLHVGQRSEPMVRKPEDAHWGKLICLRSFSDDAFKAF